jgi:hypothetical protein
VVSLAAPRESCFEKKEIIMKSFLLLMAFVFAVTLSSSLTPSVATANNVAKKDRATIQFNQPVKLMGITLQGTYLFVHDDLAMARGEACTFVYKGVADVPSKLVVSFHCAPAERAKVEHFTVRSEEAAPGLTEVKEFQFGGSTEAHLVPIAVY